ncbi:MAG: hypothetical protein M3R47_02995 [Chloroflexota bacterium]|nr:hypothetical protein [Chloroflexota bacterium]
MANELDIILKFILDQSTLSQTDRGVKKVAKSLGEFEGSFPGDKLGADFAKFQRSLGDIEKSARKTTAALKAEARVLAAKASEIQSGITQAQIASLRTVSSHIDQVSKLSLATGTALVGGILGFANKYVSNAKVATETTIAWKSAQDDLNRSGERIGAVLAKEAIPLLREGAQLAKDVASFVETHPEAVRAALNTGKVLIGLGAIGLLVSKGVKLVADVKFLATIPIQITAAKLQDAAANKQLEAAVLRAKEFGLNIPTPGGGAGAGGVAAAATSVGLVVAGVIAAKYAVDLVNIVLEKTGIAKSIADAQQKILETSKRPYPGIIAAARPGASGAASTISSAVTGIPTSPQFDAVLKAYDQYKQDDLAAVQKHYEDRKKIMADALADEQKSNASYAANVAKVNSQRSSAVAQATRDFEQANIQAEQDYQNQRSQLIRDGGQEIQQLEADLQEQLRKNRKEHEQRTADLTASRDALGLAKERDRFQDEQSEAKREAKQEIAQRRADLAQRLVDLQQNYEQERVQRFAEYEIRVAEIRAQAAQQLAELRLQHAAELREIQINKTARIKELDASYNEERKRRYQQLIQNIRDLDASLLGETNLKKQYYASMTRDLDSFLSAYRAKLGSLSGSSGSTGGATSNYPGYAEGGYASGLINTGERGAEYIMTHNTTRAAEAMIGGRLTQEGLLSALAGAGGNRQSVTWNDQRRFDGAYTNEIRRANRADTLELLKGIF